MHVIHPDVLPDSRARSGRGAISGEFPKLGKLNWVPIYCANCGVEGGMVLEENMDFAFYLCDERKNNCAAKWSDLVGTMMVPDEVFWEKAHREMIEKYGRILDPPELVEILKDDSNSVTRLCKDRLGFNDFYGS